MKTKITFHNEKPKLEISHKGLTYFMPVPSDFPADMLEVGAKEFLDRSQPRYNQLAKRLAAIEDTRRQFESLMRDMYTASQLLPSHERPELF